MQTIEKKNIFLVWNHTKNIFGKNIVWIYYYG